MDEHVRITNEMNIDQNWTLVSSTGALVQLRGIGTILLSYALSTPTSEDIFKINDNGIHTFPNTGADLYIKTEGLDREVSIEELSL